jgi:hypothetical protein
MDFSLVANQFVELGQKCATTGCNTLIVQDDVMSFCRGGS